MDEVPSPGGISRSPIEAIRTSLINGIDRYRSMKDAPESRRLLSGFALMWIGARLNTVALVVLSFQIGDGALGVGGMLAMTLLPLGIFQPIAGTLVDKFPGKRLLVITYALFTLLSFSYLLLIPFASIWLLYLIRFLSGTLQAVETPAYEVRLMMLTPSKKRGTANAVQAMAMEVGEIVGPLLGGAILALAGPSPLFILNGLSIAFLGFIIWRLPESVAGAQRVVAEGDAEAVEEEAAARRGGYRWLLKRPEIVAYIAMTLGSGALGYGIVTLFVSKALDIGINEGSIGVFFSAIGVGALLGGVFAGMGEYANRRALIMSGCASMVAALCIISFGFAGSFILAVVALFLYGLVLNIEEIPALTYFQNRLPEVVYGRFFSIFMMAGSLGGLGGSLLIPFLAERNGMVFALTVVVLPTIASALLFAVRGGGLRPTRPFIPPVAASAPTETTQPISLPDGPTHADPEAPVEADLADT